MAASPGPRFARPEDRPVAAIHKHRRLPVFMDRRDKPGDDALILEKN